MTKSFEDTLGIQLRMESEKQLFGGNIYAMAHKFPSLYITNNTNQDSLLNYIKYMKFMRIILIIMTQDIN